MKKVIIILILIFSLTGFSYSQDVEPEFDDENVVEVEKPQKKLSAKFTFGGGFGLSLGTFTKIEISPIIGYRPLPQVLVAFEGRYAYVNDSYNQFKTTYYGGGPFLRFILFRGFYAQAQAEFMNYDDILYNSSVSRRVWNTGFLLGGGYRQQMSERAFAFISVLWDLNETATSFYESPIVRVGITF